MLNLFEHLRETLKQVQDDVILSACELLLLLFGLTALVSWGKIQTGAHVRRELCTAAQSDHALERQFQGQTMPSVPPAAWSPFCPPQKLSCRVRRFDVSEFA